MFRLSYGCRVSCLYLLAYLTLCCHLSAQIRPTQGSVHLSGWRSRSSFPPGASFDVRPFWESNAARLLVTNFLSTSPFLISFSHLFFTYSFQHYHGCSIHYSPCIVNPGVT